MCLYKFANFCVMVSIMQMNVPNNKNMKLNVIDFCYGYGLNATEKISDKIQLLFKLFGMLYVK